MNWIPELLSPAGSLEKLKVCVLYGADAVYVGGSHFGLRAASDNLTEGELQEGVDFAHSRATKVFVTLNGFLHDEDLGRLPAFCRFLQGIGVDAVICSDLGVITVVREHSNLPLHLSTQASCLNSYSAKFWRRAGVDRLILGREISLVDARTIKEETGLEIELFVHGSLCTAYSGHCVISNYTAGRDSNRGGCAHSCRFEYSLQQGAHHERSLFMSSKDLRGIELLGEYIAAGVDSIKIEGRMKGPLYAATTTKIYREALDYFAHFTTRDGGENNQGHDLLSVQLRRWKRELESFSHRDYTTASLSTPAGPDSIYREREELHRRLHHVVGTVVDRCQGEMIVKVKNAFTSEHEIEALPFKGPAIPLSVETIRSLGGNSLSRAIPSSLVRLPIVDGVQQWEYLEAAMSMNISPVVTVESSSQLREVAHSGAKEAIIAIEDFSRWGKLSPSEGRELAREAKRVGLRPLLQWDLLMVEEVLQRQLTRLNPLLDSGDFDALRVQDAGALQWALEETELPLHWIAEGANHNLPGLQRWAELLGHRLERLVLSTQIPQEQLQYYGKNTKRSPRALGARAYLIVLHPTASGAGVR